MKGVVRTRVGYTGGAKSSPTYRSLGDHTEALQIDYDPAEISYKELLDIFWKSHDPASQPWSRQYMNAIFYSNEDHKRLAEESLEREAARLGRKVKTLILPAGRFHLAEDYHQKYRLRSTAEFMEEFRAMYPGARGFVNSTAAARVNGYLGGYGTFRELSREVARYGLSDSLVERLLDIVYAREKGTKRAPSGACPV